MSEAKLDTVRLQGLARAFIGSASLFAAIDLKLFGAVSAGHDTVEAFASHAGIQPIQAERLMTMCAALGLLRHEDGRYRNAPDVERFLVEGGASYAGEWLLFNRPDWDGWGRLTERLSASEPPRLIGSGYEHMTVEDARRYHRATSSIGFGAGRRFARSVDLSGRRRLMDIGGGSGAYSIVAAQTWPGLEAVVCDLPPVAVVAREFIERHRVADRVRAVACDFTRDPFPEGCDVAVMASNLPQYGPDVIRAVVAKAHAALLPGGEMHLVGEMLDDDRNGPVDAAMWGLNEALYRSAGVAHTRGQCIGYFEAAGFREVRVDEFVPGILARVSGRKA
jgi:SAM-dependent methyltransferase